MISNVSIRDHAVLIVQMMTQDIKKLISNRDDNDDIDDTDVDDKKIDNQPSLNVKGTNSSARDSINSNVSNRSSGLMGRVQAFS